jgi:hypothetical protein
VPSIKAYSHLCTYVMSRGLELPIHVCVETVVALFIKGRAYRHVRRMVDKELGSTKVWEPVEAAILLLVFACSANVGPHQVDPTGLEERFKRRSNGRQ